VEDALRHRQVTDVLVPGRIDRGDEPISVFRPRPLPRPMDRATL
jgi:hypothetical protein